MIEVLRYLKKLRDGIESLNRLQREHLYLINLIEELDENASPSRIKQFKETNGKASSFIFDMEIEKEIELINQ